MSIKIKDESTASYYNKNPLVRYFFRFKSNLAIRMANLKKNDIILDFGCGAGWLKNGLRNKGHNVTGYDITPEHTDIEDYRVLNPTKIFSLDVFEHIPKEDIRNIISDFKNMNNNFELILAIPTENLLSRKMRRLFGKSERVPDHVTTLKEIKNLLIEENLILIKKINYFEISHLFLFKNKN